MKFKDYYKVVGLAPQATADEIKAAYRQLARKFHPDINKDPGAVQRFTDLGEANEVLKDPKRRAEYDQLRADGWREGQDLHGQPQTGAAGPAEGFARGGDASFNDFFRTHFGGQAGRRTTRRRGEDLHYVLSVSLDEAYHGGTRQISVETPIDEHQGESSRTRTITVKIDKGVIHGSRMRLRGQGRPGSDAEVNGDLYLQVDLAPHRLFMVDGRDISLELPIAPWEAVLGAQISVPTLGGAVTATIPAGAQAGQKLRLKGRGLPGDIPGDQYLNLKITIPPTINDRARELYRELAKESSHDPRAGMGS